MPHVSEVKQGLALCATPVPNLTSIVSGATDGNDVYFLRFPAGRTDEDAARSQVAYEKIAEFCKHLGAEAIICILTSAPDASTLYAVLKQHVRFQLYIAVKAVGLNSDANSFALPKGHVALLVLSRYDQPLRHSTTRIAYSFCPACGKTTKDYGGKTHLYHSVGTLISDVWRDIEVDPAGDVAALTDRLRDLFAVEPHRAVRVVDMGLCAELLPGVRDNTPFQVSDNQSVELASQLINEDCLEALSRIPPDSVDFCFADLPYNLKKKYALYKDTQEVQAYFKWCDLWLTELARVIKPGRTCAVLNIPLWAMRHYQTLAKTLKFQAWIVWDALSYPTRRIMPAHYAILCFSKGYPRPLPGLEVTTHTPLEAESLMALADDYCVRPPCRQSRNRNRSSDRTGLTDIWHDIHRLHHNGLRADHPCQLPPALMRRLIALFTKPDELVLDCFNGAGTTTLTAQQLGRRFIGIELSNEYHEIAQGRHVLLQDGIDPFKVHSGVPDSKNSKVPRQAQGTNGVSKKNLQLEVKRIATEIGHVPSRDEAQVLGRYPIEYYDNRFVGWWEACAAVRSTGMSETPVKPNSPHPAVVSLPQQ